MKKVAILGSTGSIGTQALEVATMLKNDIEVVALAGGRNVELLKKQICEFYNKKRYICVFEKRIVKL